MLGVLAGSTVPTKLLLLGIFAVGLLPFQFPLVPFYIHRPELIDSLSIQVQPVRPLRKSEALRR